MLINLFGSSKLNIFGTVSTTLETDSYNLSKRAEKIYHTEWKFLIPLYTLVIIETFNWIWCLIVMSDKVKIDHPWFQMQPIVTNYDYFIFCFNWSMFTGANAIAGHELLHRS